MAWYRDSFTSFITCNQLFAEYHSVCDCGLDSTGLEDGPEKNYYEYYNNSSCPTIGGENSWPERQLAVSQE
jgi:hypothetical protein